MDKKTAQKKFNELNLEYKDHYTKIYAPARKRFLDMDREMDEDTYLPIRLKHTEYLRELDRLEDIMFS